MDITVKLFATLREGRGKILPMELVESSTTLDVLERLLIPKEDVAILLINGRDGQLDQPLKSGDVLSIFPPVGGG